MRTVAATPAVGVLAVAVALGVPSPAQPARTRTVLDLGDSLSVGTAPYTM